MKKNNFVKKKHGKKEKRKMKREMREEKKNRKNTGNLYQTSTKMASHTYTVIMLPFISTLGMT